MLLLKRKKGESFIIDDDIRITIVESNGNQIKIGIDAPQHVEIYREELYERIQADNNAA